MDFARHPQPFRIEGPTPLPPDLDVTPSTTAPPLPTRTRNFQTDQRGVETEGRSLRSPLALRLLQDAYVLSAAQEAVPSTPEEEALPLPEQQHLRSPEKHHRTVALPSPESARLLASAVNHNLLSDVQENNLLVNGNVEAPVLHHKPIFVAEAGPRPTQQIEVTIHEQDLLRQPLRENRPVTHEVHFPPIHKPLLLEPRPQHTHRLQEHHNEHIPENTHHKEIHLDNDPRYDYMYSVKDLDGNNYGHTEMRAGERTWGQYHVQLPDGRLKTVRYWADDSGYHAEVEYSGEAHHPEQLHHSAHNQHSGFPHLNDAMA